jgi:hypothetical protein
VASAANLSFWFSAPPVFDAHVLLLYVTGLGEASAKSGEILTIRLGRCEMKKSNDGHRRLLSADRKRPRGDCATK